MASKEEMKKEPVFGRFNDKFRIEEIVPMKDGISYKLTYLKFSEEFKGLIFLSEGSTLDEIIDSQHVSKNFSDAMNAVPF